MAEKSVLLHIHLANLLSGSFQPVSIQPDQSEIFKEKEAGLWAGLSCDKCEEAFKQW